MGNRDLYQCRIDSPLGVIAMISDGEALKELWLGEQSCKSERRSNIYIKEELDIFVQTKSWLSRYFAGDDPGKLPPLAPEGSEFQREVWELLRKIPYGKTCTYGELAGQIAAARGTGRMAAQAVGGAVGRNSIPILIPCHRVIGKDGRLVGYSGGLEKKIALLKLEKVSGIGMDLCAPPIGGGCFFGWAMLNCKKGKCV